MKLKKISSIIFCVIFLLSVTACGNENKDTETTTSVEYTQEISSTEYEEKSTTEAIESTSETSVTNTTEKVSVTTTFAAPETTAVTSVPATLPAVKPSVVTTAEIVDIYKKAALKSHSSVTSEQLINLTSVTINNGEYENVIDFIMPIMSKLLSNNSKETQGITGGYKNLTESDIKSAKTYKVGNNTAIEFVMKEQTDGANSNSLGGTVGHAISTVGDINVVATQLNDLGLPIRISAENTTIHYTDAIVKVLIDPDGNIINGTWRYSVDIRLNNYKVGNSTVETTSVVLDNIITVNGGFSK